MKKFLACFMFAVLSIMPVCSSGVFAAAAGKDAKQTDKYVEKKFNKMSEELDLTDKQKEEIKAIMSADRKKGKEITKKIREKDKLIDAELLKEKYDRTAVNNYLQEIRQLSADMAQLRIDGKIKIRSILTSEQFAKIEKKKKEELLMKKQQIKRNKSEKNIANKVKTQTGDKKSSGKKVNKNK